MSPTVFKKAWPGHDCLRVQAMPDYGPVNVTEMTETKKPAQLMWDASIGRIVVHAPYDSSFVTHIKIKIPKNMRSWDEGLKAWTVEPRFVMPLLRVVEIYFIPVCYNDEGHDVGMKEFIEITRKRVSLSVDLGRTKLRKIEV